MMHNPPPTQIFLSIIEAHSNVSHDVVRDMVYKDISRIRSWREHLGFTQEEVARKMGITQAALSQIESASVRPRKETLEKLAKVLGVAVEQLK